MKVTMLTIGSQGDVQPCLALARALAGRGHEVRIAALEASRETVERNGIEYLHVSGDARKVIELLIGTDVKPLEYFRSLGTLLDPVEGGFFRDIERCCEDTDIVLYSVLGSVAYHVAQARGLPCARMLFVPLDPTGDFPAMTAPLLGDFRAYNRLTYRAGDFLWADFTRRRLNGWRMSLGLGKAGRFPYRSGVDGKPVPTLYAFSEKVLPRPRDWGSHIHLPGYWFAEGEGSFAPPADLADFLAAGDRPIYVGFGSMVGGDFGRLLSEVVEATRKAGVRAIISSGWGGLSTEGLPPSVFQVGFVPHDWLFRQVSLVVHHGGAGTVAAGLRAGKPTIVVPFGGDQPFWGRQVYRIGAGPRPLPIRRLTADRLAQRIRAVYEDASYRNNAERIGEELAAEKGADRAVDVIEAIVSEARLPARPSAGKAGIPNPSCGV